MSKRSEFFERLESVAEKNRVACRAALKDFRDSFTLGETRRDREEKEKEAVRLDVIAMIG